MLSLLVDAPFCQSVFCCLSSFILMRIGKFSLTCGQTLGWARDGFMHLVRYFFQPSAVLAM